MRAVVQRVSGARVVVDGGEKGRIGRGILVFLGVEKGDSEQDADYVVDKCLNLRIFEDDAGRMNLSVMDVAGRALVVSQFTLCGDCRKGRRPSFTDAADPETGRGLYEYAVSSMAARGIGVETGVFRAHMEVHLVNDGPVTMLIDSRRRF